jgi:hypothetical protein
MYRQHPEISPKGERGKKSDNHRGGIPLKPFACFLGLFLAAGAWAQDDGSEVMAASCSLSVKTTVLRADSFDGTGKVKIVAFLCDKDGAPIPDIEIHVSANCGTFSCKPPPNEIDTDSGSSEAGFCYTTGNDGTIRVYLINIPFNKPGKVMATCTTGSFVPKASSTFIIKRAVIKGKTYKRSGKK